MTEKIPDAALASRVRARRNQTRGLRSHDNHGGDQRLPPSESPP